MQHISSELLKLVHRNRKGKMESHSADFDYQQRGDCTYLFRRALPGFLSISQTAEMRSPLWGWEPRQRWILIMQPITSLSAAKFFLSGNMKAPRSDTLPPHLQLFKVSIKMGPSFTLTRGTERESTELLLKSIFIWSSSRNTDKNHFFPSLLTQVLPFRNQHHLCS